MNILNCVSSKLKKKIKPAKLCYAKLSFVQKVMAGAKNCTDKKVTYRKKVQPYKINGLLKVDPCKNSNFSKK